MSGFTGPLRAEHGVSTNPCEIRLLEPLTYLDDEDYTTTVPAGYVADGNSCPRILWAFVPPWGNVMDRAFVLHDWLCEWLDRLAYIHGVPDRAAADRLFLKAALDCEIAAARGVWWRLFLGKARAYVCFAFIRAYSVTRRFLPLFERVKY